MAAKGYLRNREIMFESVMVIDPYGKVLGEMYFEDALKTAEDEDLDLILVSPNANPPVCRIGDYGKFIYNAEKKEKSSKKKQKVIETKEIRITPGIAANDLLVKSRSAMKFLNNGDRVRVVCKFHGREASMPEEGASALNRFLECLGEAGKNNKGIQHEGKNLVVTIGRFL